jgi:lysophospholipase L1-like esterase
MQLTRITRVSAFGSLAFAGTLLAAPPSLNLEQAFAPAREALLSGDADIVCIGDSLTFRTYGTHRYLRDRFQLAYGDGGEGYQALSVWTGGFVPDTWTRGIINSDRQPFFGLDGMWGMWNPGVEPAAAFIFAQDPVVRVQYVAGPNFGNLLATWDGGAQFVFCQADGLEVREIEIARSGFDGQTWFYPSGEGQVVILGQNNIRPAPGVRVHRVANGGWGVMNFLQRETVFDQQLQLLGTDLVIIMLGQNDQAFSRELYAGRMTSLVQRVQNAVPGAGIVLVSTYDTDGVQLPSLNLAMADVALETGVGYINVFEEAGTFAEHWARGHVDPDRVHFTSVGARYITGFIFDALHTGGASITAPCSDIDFNNDSLFPSDADLVDFLSVLAGGPCSAQFGPASDDGPGCDSIDINRDGLFPADEDLIAFLSLLAGGTC